MRKACEKAIEGFINNGNYEDYAKGYVALGLDITGSNSITEVSLRHSAKEDAEADFILDFDTGISIRNATLYEDGRLDLGRGITVDDKSKKELTDIAKKAYGLANKFKPFRKYEELSFSVEPSDLNENQQRGASIMKKFTGNGRR